MTAAKKLDLISVEEYLAGELDSDVKHEYVAGAVYVMAGARNSHNVVAVTCQSILFNQLSGSKCLPFNSHTKVRIQLPTHNRFYYPDAMVVCEENSRDETFQDNPVVIAEVLSAKTRRVDQGEKYDAYLTISSLRVYLLIEQDEPLVIAHRRGDQGFAREAYEGLEAVVPLPEIGAELPLAELYQRVDFSSESSSEAP